MRRRVLVWPGVILISLYALGAFHPLLLTPDLFFGVEAFRGFGPVVFALASGLLLVLLLSRRLPGRLGTALTRVADRIPARLRIPLLATGCLAAFALLPSATYSGDFQGTIIKASLGEPYPSNALTSFLQIFGANVLGLGARDAVVALSWLAGLVYVLAAIGIARECFPDRGRRAALAGLLLTCGAVTQFFGTVEVYAPLVAGIALYLHTGIRAANGRGSRVWPPLVLGITFCLHGSAGLLLPSLLLLANEGRPRPLRVGRWFAHAGVFLLPVAVVFAVLYFGFWGGSPPDEEPQRIGSFMGGMGQGPLLPLLRSRSALLIRYAVFDGEHLVGVLNLYLLAAPAGLALFLAARRRRSRSPVSLWVLSCAIPLVVFPLVWNVSFALRRDWDLFVPMGVPLALLGGLAFFSRARTPTDLVRAVGLSLFCFAPLVVANSGGEIQRRNQAIRLSAACSSASDLAQGARRGRLWREAARWEDVARRNDPDSIEERVEFALTLARHNRVEDAIRELRSVLALEPDHSDACGSLGVLLLQTGVPWEGNRLLHRAVRLDPAHLHMRIVLARLSLDEGGTDEAIRQLEEGIRRANTHSEVVDALLLLANIRIQRDEMDLAREVLSQAAELGAAVAWPNE